MMDISAQVSFRAPFDLAQGRLREVTPRVIPSGTAWSEGTHTIHEPCEILRSLRLPQDDTYHVVSHHSYDLNRVILSSQGFLSRVEGFVEMTQKLCRGSDDLSQNFWTQLPRPFFVLAPMADVTDAAFRRILARYGRPDVFWTEFCSADGLWHTRVKEGMPDAENPLMQDLRYDTSEHPIVAQFFTADPEKMEYAAGVAREIGFDGVDINMGCPDQSVEKQGAGAALMKTPELAVEIIRAAKRGAGSLPVSVKTRIGFARNEIATWLPRILAEEPAALTLHARTRNEMSLVPARWEHIAEAVRMRDVMGSATRIIGNGDARDLMDARAKADESGADGVMIGRGIFGNPWCFNPNVRIEDVSLNERFRVMLEHARLFEELLPHKRFDVMKHHFNAYAANFSGAVDLRVKLMETRCADDVEGILRSSGLIRVANSSSGPL